ncbi:peptide N-acetyl-beta-D-glucosaminyl asparaginase amidase A-domain-containing protein [Mycena galopus ATCC 62051]|nr:peptide N-acetyl-beta-D-glucosaminyl asparaginase amidase A-domain-containing protein [Mycena galopus ATCC 62051]
MLPALWFLCALLFATLSPQATAVLFDFQVAQPPPVPQNAKQCTVQILQRDFAFSFGDAEIVQYTPPTDCGAPGSWAAVTLNFTVTSNGTQYDRLAVFTFQNVEIWRSSTAEPTLSGIIWTYIKDVTRYTPLFAKPGTFILQLDNLISVRLTTLHATFYASSRENPPAKQANTIIPLSTFANNTGNDASVPPSFSVNITSSFLLCGGMAVVDLPGRNADPIGKLYPSGNNEEGGGALQYISSFNNAFLNTEFWFLDDFQPGTTGQGPFREVRLLVDGQVAGVAFPYPVIFTGGIFPPAWRPITSYGAFDLPTYFLDLTPFVPHLTDGKPHMFIIDVVSAEANHTILPNWYVSGVLQVITDTSSKPTSGRITSYNAEPFAQTSTTGSLSENGDQLSIKVTASRKIHITADILSGSGKANHVVFSQNLEYINEQNYFDNGQIIFQLSSGSVLSTHNSLPAVVDSFSYPITLNITSVDAAGTSFDILIDHSYDRDLLPSPFILDSTIKESQSAGGFQQYARLLCISCAVGLRFSYTDPAGNTFNRRVDAAFNNITLDKESGSLSRGSPKHLPPSPDDNTFAGAQQPRLPFGHRNQGN